MKTIKLMSFILAVIFTAGMNSQTLNKEVENVTKTNKFKVKSDVGVFDYTVKVDTKATDYVKTADATKKESARVQDNKYVTTTITVKNNVDKTYNNLITLNYRERDVKPVNVVPTTKGFDIMVNGMSLEYDFIKQVCISPENCPVDVKLANTHAY